MSKEGERIMAAIAELSAQVQGLSAQTTEIAARLDDFERRFTASVADLIAAPLPVLKVALNEPELGELVRKGDE